MSTFKQTKMLDSGTIIDIEVAQSVPQCPIVPGASVVGLELTPPYTSITSRIHESVEDIEAEVFRVVEQHEADWYIFHFNGLELSFPGQLVGDTNEQVFKNVLYGMIKRREE